MCIRLDVEKPEPCKISFHADSEELEQLDKRGRFAKTSRAASPALSECESRQIQNPRHEASRPSNVR